jgi:hypothetical protein
MMVMFGVVRDRLPGSATWNVLYVREPTGTSTEGYDVCAPVHRKESMTSSMKWTEALQTVENCSARVQFKVLLKF